MKQIFLTKSGRVVKNVPYPHIGEKEILVRVNSSVISTGTELSSDRNKKSGFAEKKELLDKVIKMISERGLSATYKRVMAQLSSTETNLILSPIGYSNAGEVVSKGRLVDGFNVGDMVACCGAGIASHAEYVSVPINMAAKIPDNVPYNEAAFATIGSIAMQGLRRANVTFGETIVVTGLGLIGLLAVQIAKAWGLTVIGVDLNEDRIKIAKSFGADICFNAANPDLIQEITTFNNGIGVDAVVIYAATKSSTPVNQAFDMCRRRGVVVAVGAIGMDLQRDKMYEKELSFNMSTSYGPGRYDNKYEIDGHDYPIAYVRWTENRNMQEFLRLISSGKLNVKPLISGSFNIDDGVEAFASLLSDKSSIACVIKYPFDRSHDGNEKVIHLKDAQPLQHKRINVGVIGAGGFVKARHLKNMTKLNSEYTIVAICNNTPGSSTAEGENYHAAYVTTNYSDILKDPDIDLIVVGTRHNLHAQVVLDSIKAGKNVLVEKPLALTSDEMIQIRQALENTPIRIYVGYNRRYSPFIQSVKSELDKKKKPIMVNYRLNAGSIPKSSWVQSLEIGGGRLIGEGCHFIDLVSYLCGGNVENVNITHLPLSQSIESEDNFIINIEYSNGNIGVVTYTSIGGDKMPKEQLEIFSGGISYVIDDFVNYYVYGKETIKKESLAEMDKGHFRLIEEIAKDLKGEKNILAPFALDFESSELSIKLVEQIAGR